MKAVGVDLGGHNITAALVEKGRPLARLSTPTAGRDPDAVLGQITAMIEKVAPGANLPVGVGIPGMLDAGREKTLLLPNFPGWEGLPVRAMLSARTGLPVRIENDANCHALGEGWAGAAAGMSDFVLFALGTGVGGAVVTGGRLLKGSHGMAGEPGHMVLGGDEPCGCGARGHLEAVSGADALERQARARGLPPDIKLLWTRRNDPDAASLWNKALDFIARGVASAIHLLDPEAVIFAGGLSRGEGFLGALTPMVKNYLAPPFRKTLDLRLGVLGNDAPVIGAAALALE